MSGGIAAGQHDQPAGQHPEQRNGGVRPGRHRHLCRQHVGQRQPDQDRRRHADPDAAPTATRGGTTVSGGILQGTTTSLQGNILNNAAVVFNQAGSGTYAGTMSGSGGLTNQRRRHGDPDRHQQLHRRHDGVGRHPARQHAEPAGQHPQQRPVVFNQTGSGTYAGVMSGSGGMTLQGGGTLDHHRQQHLHRRHDGQRQHAGGERQPRQHRDAGRNGGIAGRHRHDRRPRRPTAACWRPATRSAR